MREEDASLVKPTQGKFVLLKEGRKEGGRMMRTGGGGGGNFTQLWGTSIEIHSLR